MTLPAVASVVLREVVRATGDAGCDPDALRATLRRVVAGTGYQADVVAEWDRVSGGWLYDVFLGGADGPGFVLGARHSGVTPWAFVGARRWSEKDLVKVDETVLQVGDAVAFLDAIWADLPFLRGIVDACLLRAELRRRELGVSADEVRAGVEAFRVGRALESIESFVAERGLDRAWLEARIAERLRVEKLVDELVGTGAARAFEADPSAWDVATISRLVLPAGEAQRAATELTTGADVALLAARRGIAPSLERRFRRDVDEPLRARLFAPDRPAVVGPIAEGDEACIYHVWSIEPACFDEATRRSVARLELDRWLAPRRHDARISWNWGETARTDVVTQQLRLPLTHTTR